MNLKYIHRTFWILFLTASTISCEKYLDAKPDKKQVVPKTLQDCQALLDYSAFMNESYPGLPELLADNYYVITTDYNATSNKDERDNYIWDPEATLLNNWLNGYRVVYYSNIALDNLTNIVPTKNTLDAWNNVKGMALFFRGFAYYNLAQLYCKPFDVNTSSTDLGLPLRLNANSDEVSIRGTVQETYDRILTDLKESVNHLPITSIHKVRPNKAAAYGALARTYLSMENYDSAFAYSNKCLQLHNILMDYNASPVNSTASATSAAYTIPSFNPEVIFHSIISAHGISSPSKAKVDSVLYSSYSSDDLRKRVFFYTNAGGGFSFRGSYAGNLASFANFNGIATNEMYLIRAECHARLGNVNASMNDLNALLSKRWRTSTFIDLTAIDANDALNKILIERRKELCFKGLRWTDLRRLNKNPQYAITLTRFVNNQFYTLPPNDLRYVILIPNQVISETNMEQNPR